MISLTLTTTALLLVGFAIAATGFAPVAMMANAIVALAFLAATHQRTLATRPTDPPLRAIVLGFCLFAVVFAAAIALAASSPDTAVPAALIGLIFLGGAGWSLHFDYVRTRGHGRLRRAEYPIRFWLVVGLLAFCGVASIVVASREFGAWSA